MQRNWLTGVLLALAAFTGSFHSRQLESMAGAATPVDPDDPGAVPIGGVVLWYGNWNAEQMSERGFELCDGGFSDTLGFMRPDMNERFPRGKVPRQEHPEDLSFENLKPGGSNATRLEASQMPRHDHPISDPGHAHGVFDPGHAHRIPMGDGDGGARDKAADGDSRERRAVSTHSTKTGLKISQARTGIQVGPSGGLDEPDDEGYTVAPFDNQPAYQDFFYIIRVK